ncbi:MAG: hypothetical protein JNG89_00775 [Planctomycetaceae bacterium]|nr:hypothetical protein [Planctomycetaceae bacterium]
MRAAEGGFGKADRGQFTICKSGGGTMQRVADSSRKVAAIAPQRFNDGERSAAIDLQDVVELLLASADELELTFGFRGPKVALKSRRGRELR